MTVQESLGRCLGKRVVEAARRENHTDRAEVTAIPTALKRGQHFEPRLATQPPPSNAAPMPSFTAVPPKPFFLGAFAMSENGQMATALLDVECRGVEIVGVFDDVVTTDRNIRPH